MEKLNILFEEFEKREVKQRNQLMRLLDTGTEQVDSISNPTSKRYKRTDKKM